MAKPRSPVSAALVCQSFAQHATTCLTAAVALVPVTTVALSTPGTTMAPPGTCARGLRGTVAVALGFSQVFPRRRTPAWRCHAPSSADCRQVPGGFPAPLPDSALSAAPAPRRVRGREELSARQSPEQFFRDWPAASSSLVSSSRSFAWPPATSQVPGPLSQLPAWLHRRKIAKPRWLQHQLGQRSGRTLAGLAFE